MNRMPKKFDAPFLTLQPGEAGQSLYQWLYTGLREAILSKQIVAGAQLPSTRSLAEQLKVSRTTIVNAYEQLLAEGYITGKTGAGTFVASTLPDEAFKVEKAVSPKLKKSKIAPVAITRRDELSAYGKRLIASNAVQSMRQLSGSRLAVQRRPAFEYGTPALDLFPFDVWARLTARHWRYPKRDLLDYGSSAGYRPLREAVAAYLKSARAVNCSPDQVIIVSGAQQALDLTTRVLLNPGDAVWTENPCYQGARNAFAAAGAQLVGVPVDSEGFALNRAIESGAPPAKLVSVTPSHQFPLGVTMSLTRRLELLEWAQKSKAWIVEDDYDSEYRYNGRPLAALQGLDRAGRVIYVGTFSKTIFPALRLGCMVVPPDLVEIFITARALTDLQSAAIDQAVLTDFFAENHFARHVRKMRALYRERQEILVAEADKTLKGLLDVAPSDAGMHLVGRLPIGVCDKKASRRAAEHGIEVAPLSSYFLDNVCSSGLLLGYAHVNENEIKTGVRHLAAALGQNIICNA